jgi:hypothetical protein
VPANDLLAAIEHRFLQAGVYTAWSTLGEHLSTHQRVTAVPPEAGSARVLKIRKATNPDAVHREIYATLHVEPQTRFRGARLASAGPIEGCDINSHPFPATMIWVSGASLPFSHVAENRLAATSKVVCCCLFKSSTLRHLRLWFMLWRLIMAIGLATFCIRLVE